MMRKLKFDKKHPQPRRCPSCDMMFIAISFTLMVQGWMIQQGPKNEMSTVERNLRLFQTSRKSRNKRNSHNDAKQARLYDRDYWESSSSFQGASSVIHDASKPTIFYHIFFPDEQSNNDTNSTLHSSHAANIIQDQLKQIQDSHLAQQGGPTRILLNTVGNFKSNSSSTHDESWMNMISTWCEQYNLHCHHLQHFDTGTYEDVTLNMIHGYCSAHPSESIVYLHNKGSLHSRNGTNDEWRRSLTAAVTSSECMELSDCDACSLLFQSVPAVHFPGNMFHAKCSYIQQLLPIHDYLRESQHVHSTLKTLAHEKLLQRGVYSSKEQWALGEGRYMWEHWIGSHVHLRACDVSPTNDIDVWKTPVSNTTPAFSRSRAPRVQLTKNHWKIRPMMNKMMLLHDSQRRRRDINLLPGLLVRYAILFHQWPQPQSWVWDHFPDGNQWKEALLQNNTENKTQASVKTLIRHLQSPTVPMFSSEGSFKIDQPQTNWSIFYNMYIPQDDDSTFAVKIIQQHWRQIQESIAPWSGKNIVPIHFKTIGRMPPRGTLSEFCQSTNGIGEAVIRKAKLECKHEGHHDSAFEEETLTAMWKHCQLNPDSSVIYMHSKGTYHNYEKGENDWWRYHLTRAVTGQQCWERLDNGQCQVCGLQYYPIHTNFFPGNFFAASCSYVQHLKSPQNYQRSLVHKVLPELIKHKQNKNLLTNLYNPKQESVVGDGRFSMEHWIASHPRMTKPCDVSETANVRYWLRPRSDDLLNVSLAPRHDIWAPYYKIQVGKRKSVVMPDKSKRIREYFLLAGNLLKSILIYNELPPWDSWVWTWFPDGAEWKEAAKEHGLQVVEFMTRKYLEVVETDVGGDTTATH